MQSIPTKGRGQNGQIPLWILSKSYEYLPCTRLCAGHYQPCIHLHISFCSSRADTHPKKLRYSLSKCTAWRHFWKEIHSCIPTKWGIIVDESCHCVVLPPYLSHPPPSITSHPSPTNLHQRLLHFMRPEGMPTDSPAQVQQSMLNKYRGREIANCSCCNLTLSWDKPQAMCTSLQLRETDVSISMVYVPWQNIKPAAYCSLARARPTMIQHLPSIVYSCYIYM